MIMYFLLHKFFLFLPWLVGQHHKYHHVWLRFYTQASLEDLCDRALKSERKTKGGKLYFLEIRNSSLESLGSRM